MKYKVRDNFYLHGVSRQAIKPGETVELTAEQAATHAHKIEPLTAVEPRKAASDRGNVK